MLGDSTNNRTKNGFGINTDNFGSFSNQNKRIQQGELSEANESLKLLRLKMGNNINSNQNVNNNNINFGNTRTNTLSNNKIISMIITGRLLIRMSLGILR